MSRVAIVIPAAGASRRMAGRDKLLEQVAGQPLLRLVTDRALSASDLVFVTLPSAQSRRADVLRGAQVRVIEVPDASDGMAASLRRAAHSLPGDVSGVLVLPADMPDITGADLRKILDVFHAADCAFIVQATGADGTPGHPVVFPADLVPAFAGLTGDRGAKAIITANRARLVHVPLCGRRALTDLDTPEAWDAWRSARRDR
ncbi:NTP transferase domain-containing protein [Marivita sp. S2033]|uniref:nucleotidyltransferase family protein n=1 Tax=Marivita sp. S2033 TaxID=3373187 RepID=UPI0039828220